MLTRNVLSKVGDLNGGGMKRNPILEHGGDFSGIVFPQKSRPGIGAGRCNGNLGDSQSASRPGGACGYERGFVRISSPCKSRVARSENLGSLSIA